LNLEATQAEGRDWRPWILQPASSADRARLSALLDLPALTVVDTLEDQLVEWLEARDPTPRPRAQRMEEAQAHLEGRPLAEYGRWVYYPWRRTLVHLLPQDEFHEVRTSRNRNKITAAEQARLGTLKLGVAGLSVGHATALTLALEGVGGELRLADFDTLSLSNLNRLRTGVHHLGVNKAVLCAREILEVNPYATLRVFEDGLNDGNVEAFFEEGGALDLLFEECDDLYMKVLLREQARARRIPVLMETSDRGLIDVERFDLEPLRPSFHGLAGDVRAEELRDLKTVDKVPFVLDILDVKTLSPRFLSTLVEIDRTVKTWPQLASAVSLGGALNTDVARRIALGKLKGSGRFYVDLEQLIQDPSAEAKSPEDRGPHAEGSKAQGPEGLGTEGRSLKGLGPDGVNLEGLGTGGLSAEDLRPVGLKPEGLTSGLAPGTLDLWERFPDRDFPELPSSTLPPELHQILTEAALAPSGGNVQPWRFEVEGRRIRCWLDRARASTFLDFEGLASHLALGAAAENAELAAAALGFPATARLLPDRTNPDLAWELLLPSARTAPAPDPLHAFLASRTTNRRLAVRAPLPEAAATALHAAAAERGARLQLLDGPAALKELGQLLGEGERFRLLHRTLHDQMMAELRWTAAEAEATRDGLELASLELSATDAAGLRVASRWEAMAEVAALDGGHRLTESSEHSVAAASAIGLLTIPGQDRLAYLRGGRALERVWLTATARDLAFQPMSALPYLFARLERGGGQGFTESQRASLLALRARYRALFSIDDGDAELLLFRLAIAGPPTRRSLRRRTEDLLRQP